VGTSDRSAFGQQRHDRSPRSSRSWEQARRRRRPDRRPRRRSADASYTRPRSRPVASRRSPRSTRASIAAWAVGRVTPSRDWALAAVRIGVENKCSAKWTTELGRPASSSWLGISCCSSTNRTVRSSASRARRRTPAKVVPTLTAQARTSSDHGVKGRRRRSPSTTRSTRSLKKATRPAMRGFSGIGSE
jgi:hypothetical protein